MTFETLTLAFFRSFRETQTFWFPTQPGLYLLTGENRANPACGSNGAGKSSLKDALSWVIYGKTARGLKSTDVANWEIDKQTVVTLVFRRGDTAYELRRTHKPNTLTLSTNGDNRQTVTQEAVEGLIGFNHDAFLATVLLGQFNRFFFDLGPTEKLQVFSDILNLQYWQDKAKLAADNARAEDEKHAETEKRITHLNANIRATNEQINEAERLAREYGATHAARLKTLEANVASAGVRLDDAKDNHADAKQNLADESQPADNEGERKRVADMRRDLDWLQNDINNGLRALDKLKADRERLVWGKTSGKCPLCGSDADGYHLQNEIERIATTVVKQQRANKQKQIELDEQTPAVERAERKLTERLAGERAKRDLREKLAARVAETGNMVKNAADLQSDAQAALKTATNEPNPHTERVETLQRREKRLQNDLVGLTETLGQHAARRNGFDYWATELKNLRLWLIESSLLELEVEIANSLIQLGLRGWKITFEIERITKAGNVSRGFNVFIKSPNSPDSVKWETFSGGETQRLRLAGAVGLSALIRNRFGIDLAYETFDEPSRNLSTEGIEDLLAFLESRAVEEKRTIFIIEHGVYNSGTFAGRLKVVRTRKRGSILEQRD